MIAIETLLKKLKIYYTDSGHRGGLRDFSFLSLHILFTSASVF